MIEAGLYNLLSTSAAITDICGTRIYPVLLPEGPTLPAMTYQLIAAMGEPTQDTSGMQRWRFQLDCWGEDYLDAITLRAAVGELLNGYQGTLSDGTVLQNAEALQRVDFFEDAPRVYRAMIEFYLWFDFQS